MKFLNVSLVFAALATAAMALANADCETPTEPETRGNSDDEARDVIPEDCFQVMGCAGGTNQLQAGLLGVKLMMDVLSGFSLSCYYVSQWTDVVLIRLTWDRTVAEPKVVCRKFQLLNTSFTFDLLGCDAAAVCEAEVARECDPDQDSFIITEFSGTFKISSRVELTASFSEDEEECWSRSVVRRSGLRVVGRGRARDSAQPSPISPIEFRASVFSAPSRPDSPFTDSFAAVPPSLPGPRRLTTISGGAHAPAVRLARARVLGAGAPGLVLRGRGGPAAARCARRRLSAPSRGRAGWASGTRGTSRTSHQQAAFTQMIVGRGST
ncbi:hypothetical protein GGX14DRAFT_409144 [Mycena pura]|uniref:Uncharacterized protein n=1 Tax=Mycena pura TaxID=153505 RepID=A0AAD6UKE4_9AGAR|nr:hypothetical protein GGX14DRAFT_409144 [Mycena pura]